MFITVTGGLGFIGSHTCVELLNLNYSVVIIDNLVNSKIDVILNIIKIINKDNIFFHDVDIRDKDKLEYILKKYNFSSIIHFAGLKAVKESIIKPLLYYENNVIGSLNLFTIAKKYNVNNIIFSSSATVYGENNYPVDEDAQIGKNITNPYGQTKYMVRENDKLSVTILRYFNPVGAHSSGLLGEDPNDIPNNLYPHILKQKLTVFGSDYKTKDGTCIRDFIHVVDLAKGHIKSLKHIDKPGCYIYNLGSGQGVSVLDIIETFEKVNKVKIDYKLGDRREGDIECVYAIVDKAKKELDWECQLTLEDICRDGYKYIILSIYNNNI
jgi:UDP-glucose 4-epimerase